MTSFIVTGFDGWFMHISAAICLNVLHSCGQGVQILILLCFVYNQYHFVVVMGWEGGGVLLRLTFSYSLRYEI